MSETQASDLLAREDVGDVTVLRVREPMLRGDETTESLFAQTSALVDAGRSRLVLNFAAVVYLASMALGKLVNLLRKVRSAGGGLALCQVHTRIEEMLQMTHLADILLICGMEQEAVRSLGSVGSLPHQGTRGSERPGPLQQQG
jgi:anti-anti-sigma factor